MKKFNIQLFLLLILLASCSEEKKLSDGYGTFEAIETVISAEGAGKLLFLNIEEGVNLKEGAIVGIIDTSQLFLQKKQLLAQKHAIETKYGSISAQLNVLEQQKKNTLKDKTRFDELFSKEAATQKQIDDINSALAVIEKQKLQIIAQNPSVGAELQFIFSQIDLLDDKIQKCKIVCPLNGTVLNKFAEQYELVQPGKPLFKIADLSHLYLRVYISGAQLSEIKLGQKVKVLVDANNNEFNNFEGTISWISQKAEFTPKIIQTKEERTKMVYAVKVLVKNDGTLKIGMPGEIRFR